MAKIVTLMAGRSERFAAHLFAVAVFGLGAALALGLLWYRAAWGPVELARLSPEQRQKLVEELLAVSAAVYEEAWYEPAIGYTLRRSAQLEAWNDAFTSNEIGYRSGPVAKSPGTFRVVFVGDSWTYGMGVRERESFPKAFEELANRHAGQERKIEAWSLAMPGHNTLSELAALWFFFDRLAPDAVVICPTSNDNHSLGHALPNGSLTRVGIGRDEFGDPHAVAYDLRHLDSYRFRERWRTALAAIRDTEERLTVAGVPSVLYFVARWQPAFAHALVAEADLRSPYFVTPLEYTHGPWLNPPPVLHGTPAANRLYGALVYDAVAEVLGWQALPAEAREPERPALSLFYAPPPAAQWQAENEARFREETLRETREDFRPSAERSAQAVGPFDVASGLLSRATTLLVRRRAGAERLRITVGRLAEAPSVYPLTLTVSIPSPAGGSRVAERIRRTGTDPLSFEIPIPADLAVGCALDVVFVASRAAQAPDVLAARSLYILAIDQVP